MRKPYVCMYLNAKDNKWYFEIVAGNGVVLATSKGTIKYTDCLHSAEVITHCQMEICEDKSPRNM